jgi:hypothetical protein
VSGGRSKQQCQQARGTTRGRRKARNEEGTERGRHGRRTGRHETRKARHEDRKECGERGKEKEVKKDENIINNPVNRSDKFVYKAE